MQWQDEGIVLALRRHGEGSAVAELLTRAHGRHLGLVRGVRRESATLQSGNVVTVQWRGRLAEHLGTYRIEPLHILTGALMDDAGALAAVRAATALTATALPEREPHGALYDALAALLYTIGGAAGWAALYVHYELKLLEELGFGLDLSRCAVTGVTTGLAYVSPESGRAVCAAAAEPYRTRLLPLPAFLRDATTVASPGELGQGLALTAYFIKRHVLGPHGWLMPRARAEMESRLRAAGTLAPYQGETA